MNQSGSCLLLRWQFRCLPKKIDIQPCFCSPISDFEIHIEIRTIGNNFVEDEMFECFSKDFSPLLNDCPFCQDACNPGIKKIKLRSSGDGVSTRCRSEYPVLERVSCAGAITLSWSQNPVPEPSPGAMSASSLRSLARHRTRPHRAWPGIGASPTEPAPCLGVCASPWLKPTGYKIGHASGINSALGK